jgi:hypothetical protein
VFFSRVIITSIGAALALACAGPPPAPDNANPDAALIAIKVVLDKQGTPERVYFVRIEDGDPLSQAAVISSNYYADGYVYLLDARPGRYAAVATAKLTGGGPGASAEKAPVGGGVSVGMSFSAGPSESVTLFPGDAIQGTLIDVTPGSVSFMGAWVLGQPWMPGIGDDADAAQLHYSRLMKGQGVGTSYRLGSELQSDRSDSVMLEFLPHARERLAAKGWSRIIDDSASAASGSVATGATISGIALTCNKPFVFERDCSILSGPKRKIEVRGIEAKVAGSADGRTVAVMYASLFPPKIITVVYDAVAKELRSHGVKVRRVTAISSFGQTLGYILELDRDGYSILEDLSK